MQADDASYIATSFLCGDKGSPLTVAAYEIDPDTLCQYTGLDPEEIEQIKDKATISKMENVQADDWIPVEEPYHPPAAEDWREKMMGTFTGDSRR